MDASPAKQQTPASKVRTAEVNKALRLIAATLQYNNLSSEEGFEAFDSDGDGSISIDDLCGIAMNLNLELSEKELTDLHKALDDDSDGFVSSEV